MKSDGTKLATNVVGFFETVHPTVSLELTSWLIEAIVGMLGQSNEEQPMIRCKVREVSPVCALSGTREVSTRTCAQENTSISRMIQAHIFWSTTSDLATLSQRCKEMGRGLLWTLPWSSKRKSSFRHIRTSYSFIVTSSKCSRNLDQVGRT